MTSIGDDTNHLMPRIVFCTARTSDSLSDGGLAWPAAPDEGCIYDVGPRPSVASVKIIEQPTVAQRDAHDTEIVRTLNVHPWFDGVVLSMPFGENRCCHFSSAERENIDETSGPDSWNSLYALQQLGVNLLLADWVAKFLGAGGYLNGKDVFGLKAWVCAEETAEARYHQSSSG